MPLTTVLGPQVELVVTSVVANGVPYRIPEEPAPPVLPNGPRRRTTFRASRPRSPRPGTEGSVQGTEPQCRLPRLGYGVGTASSIADSCGRGDRGLGCGPASACLPGQ